jgi:hypothetical protein
MRLRIDRAGGLLCIGLHLRPRVQLKRSGELTRVDLLEHGLVPVQFGDLGDQFLLDLQIAREVLGEGGIGVEIADVRRIRQVLGRPANGEHAVVILEVVETDLTVRALQSLISLVQRLLDPALAIGPVLLIALHVLGVEFAAAERKGAELFQIIAEARRPDRRGAREQGDQTAQEGDAGQGRVPHDGFPLRIGFGQARACSQ